jgi:hypothetical protein
MIPAAECSVEPISTCPISCAMAAPSMLSIFDPMVELKKSFSILS